MTALMANVVQIKNDNTNKLSTSSSIIGKQEVWFFQANATGAGNISGVEIGQITNLNVMELEIAFKISNQPGKRVHKKRVCGRVVMTVQMHLGCNYLL